MFEQGWLEPKLQAEFADQQTDTYRVFSHGLAWIERYGNDALISCRNDEELAMLRAGLERWSGSPFERLFSRRLVNAPGASNVPVQIAGPVDQPLRITVREEGLGFEVDFGAGYSTGVFLDQRLNRAYLRTLNPKRVLNLFAYTCSFSVVAAQIGADTLSVDLAKKALDWGRRNFVLNGIDLNGHGFVAADVMDYLPRLVKRGEQFDAIIVDPPTFARGERGRVFQVEKEMTVLAQQALRLLEVGGAVLLSTNCRDLPRAGLERIAHEAAKIVGRRIRVESLPNPPDFRGGLPASTLWVFVS